MSYSDSNQPVQLPPPSKRVRRLGQLVLLVLLPVILLGGLVLAFRLSSRPDTTPAAVAVVEPTPLPTVAPTLLPAKTLTPTVAPTSAPAPTATEIPPPVPPEQIVALVNGQVVTTATVRVAQAVDETMSELLNAPADAQGTLLERVINLTLTEQAADQAGFVLDPGVVTATQARLLDAGGHTADDLTQSLAQRDVTLAQFQAYLGQLLRSDQFVRQQAQLLGITAEVLLRQAQDDAQISLGLAAEDLAVLPAPVAKAEPTAEPVADAPTPDPDLAQRERGTSAGQLLPDFLLPVVSLDDGAATTSLGADALIGAPAVLSFYTTWCPYCQRQTPILVESSASDLAQGIRFVGIDVKEPNNVALPYIQQHDIPYPVLLDESGSVAAAYGVPGFPTTYFLDRQGAIVDRHIGALTPEQLTAYLERILQ